MNIWILTTADSDASVWSPTPLPANLQQLRLDPATSAYSFIISKEIDGTCLLKLQLPGIQLALSNLTELQARRLGIACLLQESALASCSQSPLEAEVKNILEALAEVPALESDTAMFPNWFRGNFSSAPDCREKAAEWLRTRRLSAGDGIKVIVSDDADLSDKSRADIILTGTTTEETSTAAQKADLQRAELLRIGTKVLLAAAAACCVAWLVRKKR